MCVCVCVCVFSIRPGISRMSISFLKASRTACRSFDLMVLLEKAVLEGRPLIFQSMKESLLPSPQCHHSRASRAGVCISAPPALVLHEIIFHISDLEYITNVLFHFSLSGGCCCIRIGTCMPGVLEIVAHPMLHLHPWTTTRFERRCWVGQNLLSNRTCCKLFDGCVGSSIFAVSDSKEMGGGASHMYHKCPSSSSLIHCGLPFLAQRLTKTSVGRSRRSQLEVLISYVENDLLHLRALPQVFWGHVSLALCPPAPQTHSLLTK